MSNLLSQASLVMIPSGYKEDVVYSQIPTSGAGDLSFTRASNGTRINSAGLVEVCPWNLALQSEDFSNAIWDKNSSAVLITANDTTAPNGTLTADKVENNPSSANTPWMLQYFDALVGGQTYTYSIYARATTSATKQIAIWNNSSSWSYQNISVTTEWQRFEFTFVANASATQWAIGLEFNGAETAYFIWGAQLNIGATAKPYFPTTDRLNVPRLTYQNGGGGCPSLLLEKQSTNLVSYSQDFTNAVYTKVQVTASTNAITSPDGTVNGNSIFETTVSSTHESWQRASMTAGQLYTQSCFLKANGRNRVIMQIFDNSTQYASAIYDLSTGVVVASVGTATIQSMGNGWYRCTITGTSPATGSGYCVLGLCENTYTNSSVMPTYVGDTAKGVYWWGFQVENSSYPTSYIPTTSSSATRVADASNTTIANPAILPQASGTIFVQFDWQKCQDGVQVISIHNNSNNLAWITKNTSTQLFGTFFIGGYIGTIQPAVSASAGVVKVAYAWTNGSQVMYVNGTQVGTASDAITSSPSFNYVQLNGFWGINKDGCEIQEAVLFTTKLTNAELAQLTA